MERRPLPKPACDRNRLAATASFAVRGCDFSKTTTSSCRFTLQCGTHVLLDFNQLAETEVSLEAFQLGLPQAF